MADLTGELRAWPQDTWAKLGVDPQHVAQAVIGCWQDGEATGLQVDDLGFEEARSLTRPAMTYVRGQLRGRLTTRIGRVHRRWLHPPVAADPTTGSRNYRTAGRTPDAAVRGVRRLDGIPDGHRRNVRQRLRQDRSCPGRMAGGHAGPTPTTLSWLDRMVRVEYKLVIGRATGHSADKDRTPWDDRQPAG
jgi:hypothetical protein